jgi:hypothetical protein
MFAYEDGGHVVMHKPGIPADLLPPERLWARWGLAAVLGAVEEDPEYLSVFGVWAPGDGRVLRYDDGGCSRWWLVRCGGGRYALFGSDDAGGLARYVDPPEGRAGPVLDPVAGAPVWLPKEALQVAGGNPGTCVYWCEDGVWGRAAYPEELTDDGIGVGLGWLHDREEFLDTVSAWDDDGTTLPREAAERLLEAAETRRLTAELLEFAAAELRPEDEDAGPDGVRKLELAAALRTSAISGLDGGRQAGAGSPESPVVGSPGAG